MRESLLKIKAIYDLTWSISNNTYHPSGSPSFELYEKFEKEGCQTSRVRMSLHTGTHLDSPAHFVRSGKFIEQIPMSHLIGEGVILDLSKKYSPEQKTNQGITVEDLIEAEKTSGHKIEPGYMVIIHTGWHHIFETQPERYYREYSTLSDEAGEWLASRKVKLVGVDACDVDLHQYYEKPPFKPPNHTKNFLPNNILIVENVGGEIDKVLNKKLFFIVSPLKWIAEASPVRIISLEIEYKRKNI